MSLLSLPKLNNVWENPPSCFYKYFFANNKFAFHFTSFTPVEAYCVVTMGQKKKPMDLLLQLVMIKPHHILSYEQHDWTSLIDQMCSNTKLIQNILWQRNHCIIGSLFCIHMKAVSIDSRWCLDSVLFYFHCFHSFI